jgi:neutral trehalase
VVKKDFPKIHFYDQDLVSLYDETWLLIKDFWKKGTSKNGLHNRYFAHPDSSRINQFDTCFSTFFLVYSNRIFPVTSGLDNFYAKQEESGAIRRVLGSRRQADPSKTIRGVICSPGEFNIYKLGVKKRIARCRVLGGTSGSSRPQAKRPASVRLPPRWTTPREEMTCGGFNSQMALAAFYMSELADIINDKETNYTYKKAYFSLKTKINALMWDEREGFYYDLDKAGKRLKVKTIASFWPLIAEIPNEARGERLIEHLVDPHEFGIENPFPTLAVKDKTSTPGHGLRNGLPPLNYMVTGTEAQRRPRARVRHRHSTTSRRPVHQQREEGLCTKPTRHHRGGQVAEEGFPRHVRPLPHHASLMLENIIGLAISLPRKTVDWTIPTLESMGIGDLALKRNLISILSAKSNRGWEVHLESEKLYYLTIDLFGA